MSEESLYLMLSLLYGYSSEDSALLIEKHIDQWHKIENPEIDTHKYAQAIFDKVANAIQWKKASLFNKWC